MNFFLPLTDPRNHPEVHSQGAFRQPDGSVKWCIWAPLCKKVELILLPNPQSSKVFHPMQPLPGGYFTLELPGIPSDIRYTYRLNGEKEVPDPTSRFQPDGVFAFSALAEESFTWTDQNWKGIDPEELVICEIHVGTFSSEGTFDGVIPFLEELTEAGYTAVELMPLAQFSGKHNWGYDGVFPFAVQNSYGGPTGLKRLVDAAHKAGLAVLIDAVYNHLGPEGCWFDHFGSYYSKHYYTPWGKAINFDGHDSDPVRQLVLDSAKMWISEYHADGLRLDAVEVIFDLGPKPVLAEIRNVVAHETQKLGRDHFHVHGESDQNDIRHVQPQEVGGFGETAIWNDDFHHIMQSWLTGERRGYYRDFGYADQIVKTLNGAFVFDGNYKPSRSRRYGIAVGDTPRSRFVAYLQNHDQVGNTPNSERLASVLSPEQMRLATGILLLSPMTPFFFMGDEYGETSPFHFFVDFHAAGLRRAVRMHRRNDICHTHQLDNIKILNPSARATLLESQIKRPTPETMTNRQRETLHWHKTLIAWRKRLAPSKHFQFMQARLEQGSPEELMLVVEMRRPEHVTILANLVPKDFHLSGEFQKEMLLSSYSTPSKMSLKPFEFRVIG